MWVQTDVVGLFSINVGSPSSQGRLPVPSPLRTVLDTLASHGSSLTKAIESRVLGLRYRVESRSSGHDHTAPAQTTHSAEMCTTSEVVREGRIVRSCLCLNLDVPGDGNTGGLK